MDDTISRQAAIELLCNVCQGNCVPCESFPCEEVDALQRLPSVQPEIIRCKDCKHRPIAHRASEGIFWGFSLEFPDDMCPFECEDGWYNQYPKDDFYCAHAERKEDK